MEDRGGHLEQRQGGRASLIRFTARYDGKDYPYSGSLNWDSLALTRVDDFTTAHVQKKGGRIRLTGRRVLSKDGSTLTISSKGVRADGQPTENVLVFERR